MAQVETDYSANYGLKSARGTDGILVRVLFCILAFAILNIWTAQAWPVSIAQIAIWVLCVFTLARSTLQPIRLTESWIPIPLLLAALWGVLQIATGRTADRYATGYAVMNWVTMTLIFVTVCQLLRTSQARTRFRMFAIYFGAFIALWAILQAFSAGGKILWFYESESDYPMGPFLSFDHYSTFMALVIPCAVWEAFNNPGRSAYLGSLAALMYASVIVGGSRAGAVLIALELLTLMVLLTRSQRKGGSRAVVVMGVLILCVCSVVGVDRLSERIRDNKTDLFNLRREIWIASVDMIWARPWSGFGLGLPTWVSVYPAYAVFDPGTVVNAAHSDWLQWAGEGGIPFVLLLGLVAGRVAFLSVRPLWGIGTVFAFLHACVDFPLQRFPILLWVVAIAAALEASHADVPQRGLSGP